jgi:hypothetical protein
LSFDQTSSSHQSSSLLITTRLVAFAVPHILSEHRSGIFFRSIHSLHHVTFTRAADSRRSHWNTSGAVTTTDVASTHRQNLFLAKEHAVLGETFDIHRTIEGTGSVDVKELWIEDVHGQSDSAKERSCNIFFRAPSTASRC